MKCSLSNKAEINADIFYNMDKSQNHYAKWKNPD